MSYVAFDALSDKMIAANIAVQLADPNAAANFLNGDFRIYLDVFVCWGRDKRKNIEKIKKD